MKEAKYVIVDDGTGTFTIRRFVYGGWFGRSYWQIVGIKNTFADAVAALQVISAPLRPAIFYYFDEAGEEIREMPW